METNTVLGISGFSVLVLVFLCGKVIKKRNQQETSRSSRLHYKITQDTVWNTALFFPDYFPEKEDSTTRQLIWYLSQATTTIDVCVYGFAFPMLRDALIERAKNGVVIRIITNRQIQAKRSHRAAGIQTRTKRHLWRNDIDPTLFNDLMHHKFVVIDGFAALSGSLNWTWSSITENTENVIITTNKTAVEKFSNEFERLWEECGWTFGKEKKCRLRGGNNGK